MVVIYELVNTETGMAYIGSTKAKLSKRLREHRCLLRKGNHTSAKMQAQWDEFGEACFVIRPLESLHNVTQETRKKAEQKWIDDYDRRGLLCNSYKVAFSMPRETTMLGIEAARGATGDRWSPETNEKRRLAQLGKPKGHGAKISATKRAKARGTTRADDIV